MMRQVSILGSTGSIGTQALEIIRANREAFEVCALAAGGSNLELLARQAVEFEVPNLALPGAEQAERLAELIEAYQSQAGVPGPKREYWVGAEGLARAASAVPEGTVLNGISGIEGLEPTLNALKSGATLALANKESLVVGGPLLASVIRRPGQIVPVDSEHSALAQALRSGRHEKGLCCPKVTGRSEVRRLILTASGGPFRGRSAQELAGITPEQALAHPTWKMGPLVTINSATLFNKGLELIEASLLFDVPGSQIAVVVHPQSIVHSMVEFLDGAVIAQASPPDMRLPIALGLSWPERIPEAITPLDWSAASSWDFEPVDNQVFGAVDLARQALAASPSHPAVYTAANEVCVEAFLDSRLAFVDILPTVRRVMDEFEGASRPDLAQIKEILDFASSRARELIAAAAG